MTPKALGFGTVGTNTTKSKTLTIKNTSPHGVLSGNVPAASAPFTVTAGGGAFNLAGGQKGSVTVQFAPTAPGADSEILTITSNDPKRPSVNVKLTGKGAPGRLQASGRLSFAKTKATSVSKNFTIKNSGPGVLHGNVGATTGPFKVTAGGGDFVLNHGEKVTITVEFTPPAGGPFIGSLSLSSDDPRHASVTVKLTGIGI